MRDEVSHLIGEEVQTYVRSASNEAAAIICWSVAQRSRSPAGAKRAALVGVVVNVSDRPVVLTSIQHDHVRQLSELEAPPDPVVSNTKFSKLSSGFDRNVDAPELVIRVDLTTGHPSYKD